MNSSAAANDQGSPISWRSAWQRGFSVVLNQRVLLLLVVVAVVCERMTTILAALAPGLRADWISQVLQIAEATAASGSLQANLLLKDFPWALVPVVGAMVFGMLLLIGVITLVRDLLLHGRYQGRIVIARGGRFFWPVLRYKLPIYCVGSLISLPVALLLWDAWRHGTARSITPAAGSLLLWLAVFGVARVFLSLGTKVIVTESTMSMRRVYGRVWQIIRPAISAVIIFYLLLIALTGLTLLAVWVLSLLPLPTPLLISFAVVLMSIATLAMKTAAFDLYLQLAGHRQTDFPVTV